MINKKMVIDESKVLTMSAGDWVESQGTRLEDFKPVGVHCAGELFTDFRKKVPDKAIVVTDYIVTVGGKSASRANHYRAGTALIPRRAQ